MTTKSYATCRYGVVHGDTLLHEDMESISRYAVLHAYMATCRYREYMQICSSKRSYGQMQICSSKRRYGHMQMWRVYANLNVSYSECGQICLHALFGNPSVWHTWKWRRCLGMLLFRAIYKTAVARMYPGPTPPKLGHVCFRSTDSDMVLQYQTLSQGSDPEEQPLGSRVPFSIFSIFLQLLCYTMVSNTSAARHCQDGLWGISTAFYLFSWCKNLPSKWVVHKEMGRFPFPEYFIPFGLNLTRIPGGFFLPFSEFCFPLFTPVREEMKV
ncbi:hypothetical protein CDAR_286111 [Caerostris darwini]|uniref:Uncharacterized protein n=1 Tax=Caerostris darwini TaxID=1538125 RepID=A0AAV4N296_9ARAC|nr:hypothetical protein CDAR_286111 [Caerostris darwini]